MLKTLPQRTGTRWWPFWRGLVWFTRLVRNGLRTFPTACQSGIRFLGFGRGEITNLKQEQILKQKDIEAQRDRMMRKVETVIIHDGNGHRSWRSTLLTMFSLFIANPRVKITVVDVSPDHSFKSRWDDMVANMEKVGWKKRADCWAPIRILGNIKNLLLTKDYVMVLHPDLYCVRDLSDDVEEFIQSGAKVVQAGRCFILFKRSERDYVDEKNIILEHGELLVKDELIDTWGKDTLAPGAAFVHLGFDHKKGHDGRNAKLKRAWVEKILGEMLEDFDEYEDELSLEMAERGNAYLRKKGEEE